MNFFSTTAAEIYRKTPPASTLEDPVYTLVDTLQLSVQPFTGDENTWASQTFSNIRYLMISYDVDSTGNINVKSDDEIYLRDWEEYVRVQYIQKSRQGIIPHVEVLTTDTQWTRAAVGGP